MTDELFRNIENTFNSSAYESDAKKIINILERHGPIERISTYKGHFDNLDKLFVKYKEVEYFGLSDLFDSLYDLYKLRVHAVEEELGHKIWFVRAK